jgi:hypothetical protein
MARNGIAATGRRLAIMFAVTVLATLVVGVPAAFAADSVTLDPGAMEQFLSAFQRLGDQQPVKEICKESCHADIANTDNYSSSINFSHGYHMRYPCFSCHPRFPHNKNATVERPTMKACFNCHGLRHSSSGKIASGVCKDCHRAPKKSLRPPSHTQDWAGTPHVKPAEKSFNTECAMCHDAFSCTGCHDKKNIDWAPKAWEYDAGEGCLSCHSDPTLRVATAQGSKPYLVTGLDDTAHSETTCQQCHPDFRYDDKSSQSKIWQVNAGYACAECHESQKEERLKKPVAEWKASVHYEQLRDGNTNSATCGSCHMGHLIRKIDTPFEEAQMHGSAIRMCAKCHEAAYTSYDDYYHGAAYKQGEQDAPACWQCHNSHKVLPANNPQSTVYRANVSKTCGQEGCHKGSEAEFGEDAGDLIHQQSQAVKDNPLGKLVATVRSWVD